MKPKLLTTLPGYTLGQFAADALAGVAVAMVALPLSIATAIASGADPAKGLITAIVCGFLISLLGGSRVQIGGPMGAFPHFPGLIVAAGAVSAIAVLAHLPVDTIASRYGTLRSHLP